MSGETSEKNPENPVPARPGIPPGTTSPERAKELNEQYDKAADPASNVAPFMKVINEMKEFSRTISLHMNAIDHKVDKLQARIDAYDKFFGGEPPTVPPAPVATVTDKTPTHIQRGVHTTDRNVGGPGSG
jgi:hypothetical protein